MNIPDPFDNSSPFGGFLNNLVGIAENIGSGYNQSHDNSVYLESAKWDAKKLFDDQLAASGLNDGAQRVAFIDQLKAKMPEAMKNNPRLSDPLDQQRVINSLSGYVDAQRGEALGLAGKQNESRGIGELQNNSVQAFLATGDRSMIGKNIQQHLDPNGFFEYPAPVIPGQPQLPGEKPRTQRIQITPEMFKAMEETGFQTGLSTLVKKAIQDPNTDLNALKERIQSMGFNEKNLDTQSKLVDEAVKVRTGSAGRAAVNFSATSTSDFYTTFSALDAKFKSGNPIPDSDLQPLRDVISQSNELLTQATLPGSYVSPEHINALKSDNEKFKKEYDTFFSASNAAGSLTDADRGLLTPLYLTWQRNMVMAGTEKNQPQFLLSKQDQLLGQIDKIQGLSQGKKDLLKYELVQHNRGDITSAIPNAKSPDELTFSSAWGALGDQMTKGLSGDALTRANTKLNQIEKNIPTIIDKWKSRLNLMNVSTPGGVLSTDQAMQALTWEYYSNSDPKNIPSDFNPWSASHPGRNVSDSSTPLWASANMAAGGSEWKGALGALAQPFFPSVDQKENAYQDRHLLDMASIVKQGMGINSEAATNVLQDKAGRTSFKFTVPQDRGRPAKTIYTQVVPALNADGFVIMESTDGKNYTKSRWDESNLAPAGSTRATNLRLKSTISTRFGG